MSPPFDPGAGCRHRGGRDYRPDTENGSGPRLSDDGLPAAFCRVTAASAWRNGPLGAAMEFRVGVGQERRPAGDARADCATTTTSVQCRSAKDI